ncbi:LuxR C-terminal-related transcriptional regulator [uncultured Pseudodesulfovibrio sp.]|uniref:LuxR C-terminal-related transcriptional regulator n=1 Tax=uncultured Pseudodesulfovibrio sp. TaxID=2035858 RepID=UPI0029C7488B|nr:LuxR C-terminal-related transcriptional regulator [uncultured Pseudodesulfovibrio sp.]
MLPYKDKLDAHGVLAIGGFGLLVGWVVSVLYEGPLLYALAESKAVDGRALNAANLLMLAAGLLGAIPIRVSSPGNCRRLLAGGAAACLTGTLLLPIMPGRFLYAHLPLLALVAGASMTGWGHLLKAAVPRSGRSLIAPVAMTLACAVLTSTHALTALAAPRAGFALAVATLTAYALLLLRLKVPDKTSCPPKLDSPGYVIRHFLVLYLSIFLITLNAGFMFQAVYPLFARHLVLSSLYTNVPYVAAVLVCASLPGFKRLQTLYGGLALWGFSLILLTNLDRSATSFLLVITGMLFAAGLFDYFWWSIFTTDLDSMNNPATLTGSILAASILGSLAGGQLTNLLAENGMAPFELAQWGLGAILVNMVLIGAVNKRLGPILINQQFLEEDQGPTAEEQRLEMVREKLSPREMDVFLLLREGCANKDVCETLHISINTVKTHNRKIFAKLGLRDRADLQHQFPPARLPN